ncbi:DUF397 domain-containing protein [Streptomyces sp. O3]
MDIPWRKSSFSDQPESACVELALTRGSVLVRESDEPGVVIATEPDRLRALLLSVKGGVLSGRE